MSRRKLALLALLTIAIGVFFVLRHSQAASLRQLTELLERGKRQLKRFGELPLAKVDPKGEVRQIDMELLLVEVLDRRAPTPAAGLLECTDELTDLIRILKSQNLCTVQSEPKVTIIDGRLACTFIGQENPVLTVSHENDPVVHFQRFGIMVQVKPRTLSDGRIHIEVRADVSSKLAGDNGIVGRYVDIAAAVPDGQSLVFAGLRGERRKRMWKTPLVGNLPLIGSWFHFQKEVESEHLFLVTPRRVDAK
ncbi:MAG: type II and III secretion system protein [Gemmataceae bacterium]|nr:type II and III secretion system protein [Gemmataceae bacterium]